MDPNEFEEIISNYEKKTKILEKKLNRSEENRLHVQEMKDKTQLMLTRLMDEIDSANEIIKKRNEELKELKEQAEASVKIKSNFLANMSHEIRTPMNAIIGFSNLIYKTELTNKQEDYIHKIGNAAHNLLYIINDILDFSKIDAGKLSLEEIKFNLEEVMTNLADMISIKAFNKGLELIVMQDPNIPEWLEGDPLRLGQVLLNLTDNAIKFTEKGEIFVSVTIKKITSENITLVFEVRDMGIGLTKEQKSTLFQAFTQADTSTTRRYGGTGLGLIISKQIVELMKGDIHVSSEYGVGSNFLFTAQFKLSQEVQEKKSLPDNLKSIRTLILEENNNVRQVLEIYTRNFGFNHIECVDKTTAIKLIEDRHKYDLIIIGCSMSGNEGIHTLRQIKKYIDIEDMPKFIMLAGYIRENLVLYAIQEGFNEVIMKPINQSVLFDTIMSLFVQKADSFVAVKNKEHNLHENWNLSGIRVLLAEDNEINQQVVCEFLENEGMHTQVVGNGLEAYQELKENKDSYDIVLMDLHMPILDGYKASRKIKNEIESFQLPIIALTADAMSGTREMVLDWEMDDYLTKPINPDELYKAIHKWVRKGEVISSNKNLTKYLEKKDEQGNADSILDRSVLHSVYKGDEKLFSSILKKFIKYKDVCNEFEAINIGNIEEKIRIAHTMKGLSGNIGAVKLQKMFENIELLLRANQYSDADFSEQIKIINEMLAIISNEIEKTLKQDELILISEEDEKDYEVKFESFMDMLQGYDARSKKILDEISPHLKKIMTNEDYNKVAHSVLEYDFETAYSILLEKVVITTKYRIWE
ncbi:MAG: hypothetical protein CVU84_04960 [Firmicutes bacterium HGW-Firmicutes-1]|jgi:polar amino acid transport system substrate-binding protein|nr:MAG: hypothetical protein CVU84_04960 [Firmicutes bacterium HGW-Firmicutes-1]